MGEGLQARKESLIKAFELIKTPEEVVVFEGFEKMMRNIKSYSPGKIQFIFHMLDKDHDEELSTCHHLMEQIITPFL